MLCITPWRVPETSHLFLNPKSVDAHCKIVRLKCSAVGKELRQNEPTVVQNVIRFVPIQKQLWVGLAYLVHFSAKDSGKTCGMSSGKQEVLITTVP
jgi:hypothetical protein